MSPVAGTVGLHTLGVKVGWVQDGRGFHGKVIVPLPDPDHLAVNPGEHFRCPHFHATPDEALGCARERVALHARMSRQRLVYEEVGQL